MFLDHKKIIKMGIHDGGKNLDDLRFSPVKSIFPSFSFIEPGTNEKVEFSFHADKKYSDKYVLIKRVGVKNRGIRVPKVILEVAVEHGWE
tara:strand:- start:2646 stop:2915 length:270 start_codon:yes stop_codon:yes gene_type:complete